MENQAPGQIQERHRARSAVIYTRQSSPEQVVKNIGSTFAQRDLVELAIQWGWPRSAIHLIEDLGLSGTATEHRGGYQELVKLIEADEVGVLFIADFARGGRDDLEWLQLLFLCRLHDTLIWADGRLYDLRNSGDFLTARMLTTLAQYDNEMRRAAMIRGRDAKAKRGLPVTAAPAGYIRNEQGKWEKDPSAEVRNAMDAIFRAFRKGGSLRKTLDLLVEWGVRLPRRTRRGVRWANPTVGLLQAIIKHPVYAGDLVYRRRCVDPSRGRNPRGHYRLRNARPEEMIVYRDAHAPYLSHEDFDANQRRLEINSNHTGRGKVGKGPALLQSLLRCEEHKGRAFGPAYKRKRRDGGQSYSYFCQGEYCEGGETCIRLPGARIDQPVVRLVLQRLAPIEIDRTREEYERLREDERGELYRLETELRAVSQEVTNIEYLYDQSARGSRHTRRRLESRLDEALQRQDHLERRLQSEKARSTAVDVGLFEEVRALYENLEAIFWAPTTKNVERKQILRLMLEGARVVEHTPEYVLLRLVWVDGAPPTLCEVKLAGFARRRIAGMAGRFSPAEIAAKLNAERLRTKYDAPWSENSVSMVIRRLVNREAD